MTTITLESTREYFGVGGKDDYVVLLGGRVIGGIFRPPEAPENEPWFWTITDPEKAASDNNRGYAATRDEAMAEFKARWLGT